MGVYRQLRPFGVVVQVPGREGSAHRRVEGREEECGRRGRGCSGGDARCDGDLEGCVIDRREEGKQGQRERERDGGQGWVRGKRLYIILYDGFPFFLQSVLQFFLFFYGVV